MESVSSPRIAGCFSGGASLFGFVPDDLDVGSQPRRLRFAIAVYFAGIFQEEATSSGVFPPSSPPERRANSLLNSAYCLRSATVITVLCPVMI